MTSELGLEQGVEFLWEEKRVGKDDQVMSKKIMLWWQCKVHGGNGEKSMRLEHRLWDRCMWLTETQAEKI